jgi:SAM-dependent methyltransferase
MELFGLQLKLADFPHVKSLRGLGTSDSGLYAKRLAEVFDYRNTFYDREPRFDLGAAPGDGEQYDFILSSDFLEHVAPPAVDAFRNIWNLLKPGGVLVFTVPYDLEESLEHFPDLFEYGLTEIGGRTLLVNRTRSGEFQVKEELVFHIGITGPSIEMRQFSEPQLRQILCAAGFTSVKIYFESYTPFGVVPAQLWSLPIAARKGSPGYGLDTIREVMDQWLNLRTHIAQSKWCRLGGKLGLF